MNQETKTEPSSETPFKPITISFSQYSMWLKCPMQWKLKYVDNLAPFDASINTAFGDAIHIPLQEYLTALYGEGGTTAADAIDVYKRFCEVFDAETAKLKQPTEEQLLKLNEEEMEELGLVTPEKIGDFKRDGKNIIDYLLSPTVRRKHFPSKQYEIVGVELPLIIPLKGGKIVYKGYLDIVFRDRSTKKITIMDFKTSTLGWNKYQLLDRTKIDQLLLYKRFYSKVFDVPMKDIEVEFFILKRKLLEDVKFPQQRIQRVTPPDGKLTMKMVEESFLDFVNSCFTPEGKKNVEGHFFKNPDKNKKNCKYCPFKTLVNPKTGQKYCDGKEG